MNETQIKSKSQLKKEIKEQKQNEAKCLFCGIGFGWDIRDLDSKIKQIATEKTPQAFLICVNCMTGGELPDDDDLKVIREGWKEGGILLTNYKVYPRGDSLLMSMVEAGLKNGNLRVYWADKKVYMEATHGGITIELNVYRETKNEDKQ